MSTSRVNDADPRIGTNTSDHTYQSARVVLVDAQEKPLLSLQGCTWNLMNYGISLKTNGFHPNNPWDFDEDHLTYMIRKTRQLNKIIEIIEDSDENDFFLLQEVDIFFPASPKLKVTASQQKTRNLLKLGFEINLRALGWKILLQPGSKTQQPLVILFNTKSLQISGAGQGVFPTATHQCRGVAQEFIHLPTQQPVTLVNLHLDYETDYSKVIPDFQLQQTRSGKFTIMAGDTNHAPNQEIVGLINTWSNITNISGEKNGISHLHKNFSHIKKCYDGFFANPSQDRANPLNQTAVHITEQAAEVFKIDTTGKFVVEPLPANPHVHRSAPGEPWRRGGYADYLQRNKIAKTCGGMTVSISTNRDVFFATSALALPSSPTDPVALGLITPCKL
jgi:hypothetical protein